MKKIIGEFKEFIARGNVLDMAIGVVIGGAFGKITTSLVSDILMPAISAICGTRDMTALNWVVRPQELNAAGEVVKESITIGFGTFAATVIDFLLIAMVIFAIVKTMNAMKRKLEKPAEPEVPAPAPEPEPTKEELLLTEIRDLLKEK